MKAVPAAAVFDADLQIADVLGAEEIPAEGLPGGLALGGEPTELSEEEKACAPPGGLAVVVAKIPLDASEVGGGVAGNGVLLPLEDVVVDAFGEAVAGGGALPLHEDEVLSRVLDVPEGRVGVEMRQLVEKNLGLTKVLLHVARGFEEGLAGAHVDVVAARPACRAFGGLSGREPGVGESVGVGETQDTMGVGGEGHLSGSYAGDIVLGPGHFGSRKFFCVARAMNARDPRWKAAAGQDNTFGRGYVPLPPELSGLGRFVENLRPNNLVDHKVFPDDGVHMLTAKVNTRLSIMVLDMKSLIKRGLVRVQCNEIGTLSFYFQVGMPAETRPGDIP